MFRKIVVTILVACVMLAGYANVSQHTADSIANLLNQKEIVCDKTCPLFESENTNTGVVNTIFIDLLVIIGSMWLYHNYKKKYFIGIGFIVVIIVTASLFYKNTQCIEYSKSSCLIVSTEKTAPVTTDGLTDFQQIDSTTENVATSNDFTEMKYP
jgi:hypothetical protein